MIMYYGMLKTTLASSVSSHQRVLQRPNAHGALAEPWTALQLQRKLDIMSCNLQEHAQVV